MYYATIDKELLCVITTLRELRSMLLGAELHIHTDHQNILRVGDSSERRLRWISYVDEYSPTLHYVEGPHNVIADTFSRLSRKDDAPGLVGKEATVSDSAYYSFFDDKAIFDCLSSLPGLCYLNLPEDMLEDNPLDIENIKEKQDLDKELQQSATRHPRKNFHTVMNVLCYTKPGDDPANWKIALPKELIGSTVKWYHQVTGHPGSKRLYEQIKQRYHHRDLQ
jgi:hypothetical protein